MTDEKSSPFLLVGNLSNDQLPSFPTWCPYATTLMGYSRNYRGTVIIQLRCKRWGCRVCGERKVRHLAMRVASARPNRFLTLTVDPKQELSPRDAWERNTPAIPQLVKSLRKKYGEFAYFRVLEVTKAGWPHWHLVCRSNYVPHAFVKQRWAELTGATIVDIRQIKQSYDCYRYVVKYLGKQKYIRWTDRRCTWSKDFFPPPEKFEGTKIDLVHRVKSDKHPHFMMTWLCEPESRVPLTSDAVLIPGVNLVGASKREMKEDDKKEEQKFVQQDEAPF